MGKIFGRSVKNFGRPGQFLKVWKKIRNVREKISEKMYGKKSRGSKILATRGRGDFVKFYLATPKCVLPLKCPPPQIPRPGAATVYKEHRQITESTEFCCTRSQGMAKYLGHLPINFISYPDPRIS